MDCRRLYNDLRDEIFISNKSPEEIDDLREQLSFKKAVAREVD